MGNSIYEENRRLRAEAEERQQQERDEAERQDELAKQNVAAIIAGIAGLLSGKATIYVGDIPVQVRWMHEPAAPRQPSDNSDIAAAAASTAEAAA